MNDEMPIKLFIEKNKNICDKVNKFDNEINFKIQCTKFNSNSNYRLSLYYQNYAFKLTQFESYFLR